MILTPDLLRTREEELDFCFPNVRQWQTEIQHKHLLPLIGIAGTRGKSTVLRLIDAVLQHLRLHVATWTDLGVQINGRTQRAELAGWGRAMMRLAEGRLDMGLQELDSAAVGVAGLPQGMYPVMVHTGLREFLESNDFSSRLNLGLGATLKCVAATHFDGIVVANGDDHFVLDALQETDAVVILVSQSRETPNLRTHLENGGLGVWVESGAFWLGSREHAQQFGLVSEFPLTFDGQASFNLKNIMLALGTLHAIGVDLPTIRKVFQGFRASWDILPASMNLYQYNDARVAIDQLAPSWILKDVLRVLNPGGNRRQITVVGDLSWIELDEVADVGRLLGRYGGAIVLHGTNHEDYVAEFKRGLASTPFPPLLSTIPTERRAINRAFKALRPGDVLILLTTRESAAAHRAVRRNMSEQIPRTM